MASGADQRRVTGTRVALALLTLVTYLPVLTHGFIRFDDPVYVTSNPWVKAGLTWEGIAWAFTANVASNWHPLTLLSHMLDCELFGLDPLGHHLTSLLLHTASVVLLFEVLRRLTRDQPGDLWRSAAVAGLFAIHPTHVESVAWIAERKDVLSGLFWMLTLLAWTCYVRQPSRLRYAAVALSLTAGLLSKPMVVTLPFVLLLLDVWPLDRKIRVKEKLPLFALAAASCVATVIAQSGAIGRASQFPLRLRLANAVLSYVAYLGKTLLPSRLAVFYPMPTEFPAWKVAGAALLLASLTVLALRAARYVTVGWLWFLGTLVPVIGIVQVGGQAMADRYTYLPAIGLFLIAVWGFPRKAVWVPILLALAIGTRLQLRHWEDSESLFRHAAAVTERNFIAHLHLAQIHADRGERGPALEHFRTTLEIRPGMWQAQASLGNTLRRWGRPDKALPHLRNAVRLRPHDTRLRRALTEAQEDARAMSQ
ncbi:MAG TPA: tetratricopeptide repeat protein [Thermoanaerobaculia bacterium]|nr:tetratricopeptide repeat protein [Thermoanaerobaculia bacterium]